jgi:hypothetical protein
MVFTWGLFILSFFVYRYILNFQGSGVFTSHWSLFIFSLYCGSKALSTHKRPCYLLIYKTFIKMKSSIRIDFIEGNLPAIKVKIVYSDDVRDRLVASFFDHLDFTSSWAEVEFHPIHSVDCGDAVQTVVLKPVGKKDLRSLVYQAALRLSNEELDAVTASLVKEVGQRQVIGNTKGE